MTLEQIEAKADAEAEAMFSPMPTVEALSLRDNPAYCKCPRCWTYHAVKANFDGLCDRCCRVLIDHWPEHESVPHILKSYETQRQQYRKEPHERA